jgi:hypothetical protein
LKQILQSPCMARMTCFFKESFCGAVGLTHHIVVHLKRIKDGSVLFGHIAGTNEYRFVHASSDWEFSGKVAII